MTAIYYGQNSAFPEKRNGGKIKTYHYLRLKRKFRKNHTRPDFGSYDKSGISTELISVLNVLLNTTSLAQREVKLDRCFL